MQTVTLSNATIPEWQKYTLGAPEVRKIPEGYVIIEMYNTSCNTSYQPVRGGVEINGENYWPVKLKHWSTGHTKWLNLHSDEPTRENVRGQKFIESQLQSTLLRMLQSIKSLLLLNLGRCAAHSETRMPPTISIRSS